MGMPAYLCNQFALLKLPAGQNHIAILVQFRTPQPRLRSGLCRDAMAQDKRRILAVLQRRDVIFVQQPPAFIRRASPEPPAPFLPGRSTRSVPLTRIPKPDCLCDPWGLRTPSRSSTREEEIQLSEARLDRGALGICRRQRPRWHRGSYIPDARSCRAAWCCVVEDEAWSSVLAEEADALGLRLEKAQQRRRRHGAMQRGAHSS